jgi:phosphoenolpyruvate---glycerone phosphotransferase subunit DhaK
MKKLLNSPETYVDEMLEGLCAAHPQYYRQTGPQGLHSADLNSATCLI